MSEREEALMRIVVGIVSGMILQVWKIVIYVWGIFHFIVILFNNKRNKTFAEFCHVWNCQVYIFLKYMTFATNKRPFPFNPLVSVDKVDMRLRGK